MIRFTAFHLDVFLRQFGLFDWQKTLLAVASCSFVKLWYTMSGASVQVLRIRFMGTGANRDSISAPLVRWRRFFSPPRQGKRVEDKSLFMIWIGRISILKKYSATIDET
jgi:hypothetical protein